MSQVLDRAAPEATPADPGAARRWAGRLAPYALLIVLPFLLLAADPQWPYSPPGGIDAWFYQGFFRSLPQYQGQLFRGTYYGSRLSWILPGYCAYQVLPPAAANLTLHLGVFFLAVFSFYALAARTISRRAALCGAVLFGANPWSLHALGGDYVDGVCLAYYLLTLALVARAASSARPLRWLALAGAAAAALVHANIVWVPAAPLFFAFYLFARRRGAGGPGLSARRLAPEAVALVAGAVVLTAGLGLANRHYGGRFLFFMPSVQFVRGVGDGPNPYKHPAGEWLPHAAWLAGPALGLLCAAAYYLRRAVAGRGAPGAAGWWPLNCLALFALVFAAQFRGAAMFQYYYYAVFLLPPALLAACALLRDPLEGLRRTQFAGALAVLTACAVLVPAACAFPAAALPLSLAAGAAGVLVVGLCPGRRPLVAVTLALLALAGALSVGDRAPLKVYPAPSEQLLQRSVHFARLDQGVAAVHAAVGDRRPRFWYDREEDCRFDASALSSVWLWGYSLVNDRFPGLESVWSGPLAPGEVVVIISRREGALGLAVESMRGRGVELRPTGRYEVRGPGEGYSLSFAEVISVAAPAPRP